MISSLSIPISRNKGVKIISPSMKIHVGTFISKLTNFFLASASYFHSSEAIPSHNGVTLYLLHRIGLNSNQQPLLLNQKYRLYPVRTGVAHSPFKDLIFFRG